MREPLSGAAILFESRINSFLPQESPREIHQQIHTQAHQQANALPGQRSDVSEGGFFAFKEVFTDMHG
jgi:hypothetical protein